MLIRLGNKLDGVELRDGFPKTADELYRYHAIVLDDLEAGFFTPDQLALLRNFVSQRGGGLLMLGGPDSFVERQVRPHSGRRALARLSESVRAGPGRAGVSAGAHAGRLAATLGSIAKNGRRRCASGWQE